MRYGYNFLSKNFTLKILPQESRDLNPNVGSITQLPYSSTTALPSPPSLPSRPSSDFATKKRAPALPDRSAHARLRESTALHANISSFSYSSKNVWGPATTNYAARPLLYKGVRMGVQNRLCLQPSGQLATVMNVVKKSTEQHESTNK